MHRLCVLENLNGSLNGSWESLLTPITSLTNLKLGQSMNSI